MCNQTAGYQAIFQNCGNKRTVETAMNVHFVTVLAKAIIYRIYNQSPLVIMLFIFSVLQQTCLCMQLVSPVGSQNH